MAEQILLPEFFVDFTGRIHSGGIAIKDTIIIDAGSHVTGNAPKHVLKNQVVMPGFVNAHSHAFHRALRGLVERKPRDVTTHNFFSWRQLMYALACSLSADEIRIIAQFAYLEMLEAGFTHVGEFHYLHHSGTHDLGTMSRSMAQAAHDARINLVLLMCAYQRNSFTEPLKPEQARFGFATVDNFLAFLDENNQLLKNTHTPMGVAIHSVRAVDESWFQPIHEYARAHKMPLHIHASEQRAEVDACVAHRQCSPIALLNAHHLLAPTTTLVHATHLISDDVKLIQQHKPTICVCPSTEQNLGDGFIPLADVFHKTSICVGTDQHVRLDPFQELRSLEELERLRTKRRLVLNREGEFLYEALLPCLTKNGLRSLYPQSAFTDLIGCDADLIAIELPPEYEWHGPQHALDALLVAADRSKITTVITKGEMVVKNGQLIDDEKKFLIQEIGKIFRRINLA